MNKQLEACVGLAGLYQATALVSSIAHTGNVDINAFEASIHSLFQTNAVSTLEVYNGLSGVRYGLERLLEQFTHNQSRQIEITRYSLQLILLENKLKKNPAMLKSIADGIDLAQRRQEHFDMLHNNIIAQVADIYSDTVSHIQPKVMVKGDPVYLGNEINAQRIRTLLLAGVRSTMLWRQKGGTRWQLLFNRRNILKNCEVLLDKL